MEDRKPRKAMPDAIRRDRWIRVRISTLEEQLFKANAQQAGMEPSAFVRAQVCGVAPREEREAGYVSREHHGFVGSNAGKPESQSAASVASSEPPRFDELVKEFSRTMPPRNAEILARREIQR